MKRLALIVGLLVCLASPSPLAARPHKYSKETPVDMSGMKTIFLGWVDLSPETWRLWGYNSKEEWTDIIRDLNVDFQSSYQGQYLAGRAVTFGEGQERRKRGGMTCTLNSQTSILITTTTAFACRFTLSTRKQMLKLRRYRLISITKSGGSSSSCICGRP